MLGAHPGGEFGLHHLVHHHEPGGRGERQQAVFDGAGHVGQGERGLERQAGQPGGLGWLGHGDDGYLLPPRWSSSLRAPFMDTRNLARGKAQVGDHRLHFNKPGDNLEFFSSKVFDPDFTNNVAAAHARILRT
ncbi:MAG: hypothetical protein ACT4PO_01845 [Actinomycetota bacterium]